MPASSHSSTPGHAPSGMRHGFLYICVSVGGAAVLAVEILGTRILGPFYGVSLFLWSALITVTLAALSVGYALGGRWADRGATIQRLCVLLAGAGVWLLIVPWLRQPILWVAEPFGLRIAVLIAAFILFFPPLLLLGMVSPYAIKLKTASLGEVGRSAGNLYAVSTLASVAAALATGFLLIPHVGVTQLTLAIGLVLIVTGSIGFARSFKTKASGVIPVVILLIGAGGILTVSGEVADPERGLLTVRQSPYAEIRVVDADDTRYLLIDGAVHTSVELPSWEARLSYVSVLDIPQRFFGQPGDMLLVGLGGGSVVKHYARAGWDVDAVEIDPVVTEMAYRYFGLDSAEALVYHMDGRRFLQARDRTYDIIALDAFGSSSIPFHLVTTEAFGLIRSRLKPGGVLAMNIEAVGWHDVIVRSLAATAHRQFEHVTVLPIAEPPSQFGNIVIVASNRALDLREELPAPMYRFSPEYDRKHAWDNRFAGDTAGAPVLTDELNPVDVWSERINLAARKELHAFFGEQAISW